MILGDENKSQGWLPGATGTVRCWAEEGSSRLRADRQDLGGLSSLIKEQSSSGRMSSGSLSTKVGNLKDFVQARESPGLAFKEEFLGSRTLF